MKQIGATIAELVQSLGLATPQHQATTPLSHIKKASHGRCGEFVYIIHHSDEALYVGSTVHSVYQRISGHKSGGKMEPKTGRALGLSSVGRYIKWDAVRPIFVTALEFSGCDTFDIERVMIEALRPRFNRAGVGMKFFRLPPRKAKSAPATHT
jgi:hypothetical protein